MATTSPRELGQGFGAPPRHGAIVPAEQGYGPGVAEPVPPLGHFR